jgi:hypothetical protein
MSYQEKRTVVSIVTGALILAGYFTYALGKVQAGAVVSGDLKYWAGTMLLFIGIGIVATIIIQIVFHILLSIAIAVRETIENGDCGDKQIERSVGAEIIEDEMGKLIQLKSMRVGFFFAGFGFVMALIALILNYTPVVMLNIMFVSFSGGSILEGFTQLYYYKKGLSHG